MPYQTKQQQAVLHCLEQRGDECLTAADLAVDLRREGCTVGLATVYRQLDKLTRQGWSQNRHGGGRAVPVLPPGRGTPGVLPAPLRGLRRHGAPGLRPAG